MAIGKSASRSTPQMHHGIYIMGCIWQPFWILQEKVGISFYFWIIRVVNSQLALYSYVRCNPLGTPWHPLKHPWNTPPHMTIINFNYEGSYLPGVICHIVKADLGRSPGKSIPPVLMSSGQEWQFHIATDILWSRMAIGRSAGRSTPPIDLQVDLKGNFGCLPLELI